MNRSDDLGAGACALIVGKSIRVEDSSVGGISAAVIAAGMPLPQNIITLLLYEYKLDAFAILHT